MIYQFAGMQIDAIGGPARLRAPAVTEDRRNVDKLVAKIQVGTSCYFCCTQNVDDALATAVAGRMGALC